MRPHPHLYEIPTWAWLAELARDRGMPGAAGSPGLRLVDVPDDVWDAFEARGFDLIWLMGIWRRSPESRRIATEVPSLREAYDRALPGWQPADVVGSPYAVHAYEPDPALASWDELDAVRAKLHRRGLQLVLDFVPNHTARDHPWVREHPEYYVRASSETAAAHPGMFFEASPRDGERVWLAHGRDPYWPGWTDTAQLNYSSGAMRAALIDELKTIAAHADGVRCDVAMLVLNDVFAGTWRDFLRDTALPAEEFWAGAATAVPDLLLVARSWGFISPTTRRSTIICATTGSPTSSRTSRPARHISGVWSASSKTTTSRAASRASAARVSRGSPCSTRRFRACGSTITASSTDGSGT